MEPLPNSLKKQLFISQDHQHLLDETRIPQLSTPLCVWNCLNIFAQWSNSPIVMCKWRKFQDFNLANKKQLNLTLRHCQGSLVLILVEETASVGTMVSGCTERLIVSFWGCSIFMSDECSRHVSDEVIVQATKRSLPKSWKFRVDWIHQYLFRSHARSHKQTLWRKEYMQILGKINKISPAKQCEETILNHCWIVVSWEHASNASNKPMEVPTTPRPDISSSSEQVPGHEDPRDKMSTMEWMIGIYGHMKYLNKYHDPIPTNWEGPINRMLHLFTKEAHVV